MEDEEMSDVNFIALHYITNHAICQEMQLCALNVHISDHNLTPSTPRLAALFVALGDLL